MKLETLIGFIKETDEQISELTTEFNKKISKLEEEKGGNISIIKDRIRNGESTGDKIRDYIIMSTGQLYFGKLESPLRDLNVEIEQHQNEQVVVLYKSEHDMIKHINSLPNMGLMELSHTVIETRWKLGFLEGEMDFNLNNGEVLIPTKNYVEGNDSKNLKLEHGCIPIKGYELSNQLNPLGENLDILIGNNIVELYFKHPSYGIEFLKEKVSKGNVIEGAFIDERTYKKYAEALRLLVLGKEKEVTALAK